MHFNETLQILKDSLEDGGAVIKRTFIILVKWLTGLAHETSWL